MSWTGATTSATRSRRIWGKGKGSFTTKGSKGSASVRGTEWLTEDRCNGTTLFRVRSGIVAVRDFAKKKTIMVKAGKSYVAGKKPKKKRTAVNPATGALKGAISPIAEVFKLPDLRRLALANGLSQVGFWGYGVAVGVYAFGIGGAALVGIAYVARLVPSALLAPFMAALADRFNRRRVLIWTNLAQAIIIALAAAGVAADIPPAIIFTLAGLVTIITSASSRPRTR